jgi:hypothetical protein
MARKMRVPLTIRLDGVAIRTAVLEARFSETALEGFSVSTSDEEHEDHEPAGALFTPALRRRIARAEDGEIEIDCGAKEAFSAESEPQADGGFAIVVTNLATGEEFDIDETPLSVLISEDQRAALVRRSGSAA